MDILPASSSIPKPNTVAGQPVSYSLLMSFNDIEERADLKAFKEFMDLLRKYWTWLYRGRRNSSRR
jgi:hypothetical protein